MAQKKEKPAKAPKDLVREEDGYKIRSIAGLDKAIEIMEETQEAIAEEVEDIALLRKAITSYLVSNDILKRGEWGVVKSDLREWIVYDEDKPSERQQPGVKSLKEICDGRTISRKGKKPMKLWNYITKRVADGEKIDLAVKRGWIAQSEIGKALILKPRAPYIRKGKPEDEGED